MKYQKIIILLFIMLGSIYNSIAQEPKEKESKEKEYIEFNDRRNIVHGVYLGVNLGYGEIDSKATLSASFKLAYVANQKIEIGIINTNFYSNQNALNKNSFDEENSEGDILGGYFGVHFEPTFFTPSIINISFPILIGGGGVGYVEKAKGNNTLEDNNYVKKWEEIFVVEPGINVLFNFSRYIQIEAGVKYRFSSKFNLHPGTVNRINGYTVGAGIKIGVFNLGRNRYKKNIPDNE